MRVLISLIGSVLLLISCLKEPMKVAVCDEPGCETEAVKAMYIELNEVSYVIVGSQALNFIQAFEVGSIDGEELELSVLQSDFPVILQDQFDNRYDVFGRSASSNAQDLQIAHSGIGYWFVWSSIFPSIILEGRLGEGSNKDSESILWAVDSDFVSQGAATDGIPAINDPVFRDISNKEILTEGLLSDSDEVLIVPESDGYKIYPIKILNYHEIVNDFVNGIPISVCYAPFTNTSSVWNREVDDQFLEFGVSGKVYNNNILLFDRNTESLWCQLLEEAVNGTYIHQKVNRLPYFRTKWSTWREVENSHKMLTGNSSLGFDYGKDPLGDYSTNHAYLPFPISNQDQRRKSKEVVFGLTNGEQSVAFEFTDF